jgi:hypothetical protein
MKAFNKPPIFSNSFCFPYRCLNFARTWWYLDGLVDIYKPYYTVFKSRTIKKLDLTTYQDQIFAKNYFRLHENVYVELKYLNMLEVSPALRNEDQNVSFNLQSHKIYTLIEQKIKILKSLTFDISPTNLNIFYQLHHWRVTLELYVNCLVGVAPKSNQPLQLSIGLFGLIFFWLLFNVGISFFKFQLIISNLTLNIFLGFCIGWRLNFISVFYKYFDSG